MQYNFRGKYDVATAYSVKDVVSYQPTINDSVKYYFCLKANTGQMPTHNADSQYWGVINALSNFPNTIDTFQLHTNLSASDKTDYLRFQALSLQTTLSPSEQDELTNLTIKIRNKLFLPEDINAIQDSISNLQMFFKDNVTGYIQTKQAEFQAEIDKFAFFDEYNPTTTYQKKNTVSYQGQSYICKENNVLAVLPTDTSKWALIAKQGAKGEQGTPGIGLRFKGTYNQSLSYFKDDVVQFGGNLFACLQDNIGQQPDPKQDTIYWSMAIARGQSTKVSMLTNTVNVTTSRSNVSIGVLEFNPAIDALMVIKNSTVLTEGKDYSINANGSSIDNLDGLWDGTTIPIEFNFIVFKNFVVDLTFSDGNMIQAETVGKEKLKVELQNELNDKATKDDLQSTNDKLGSLSNLNTVAKDNTVNAINEINSKIDTHKLDLSHVHWIGTAIGTNTLSATYAPITNYKDGLALSFKNTTASSSATTLNINGLGAIRILKANGSAVTNLKANGVYSLRYVGGNFILQGEGGEYGTATSSQVLSGYTFGTEDGIVNGAITNNGSGGTVTPGTVNQTKKAGYYSSDITIAGASALLPENIKKGISIFGITGILDGKQYASGSSTATLAQLTVSGLLFDPKIVIVTGSPNDRITYLYVSPSTNVGDYLYHPSRTRYQGIKATIGSTIYEVTATNSIGVGTKLFQIDSIPSGTYNWIAFE